MIRFNYPMYVGALLLFAVIAIAASQTSGLVHTGLLVAGAAVILQLALSLLASSVAYDWSGLYSLPFLPQHLPKDSRILNINAGFDECTEILAGRYPDSELQAYDFYDPRMHTEASIRRARTAYPPVPGTKRMTTAHLPESGTSIDLICVVLAAHEIRHVGERRAFLAELRRVLKPGGRLVIVEHLRDLPNTIAYSVGALHFFSRKQWRSDFSAAGLQISGSKNLNRFIHCWILTPDRISA